MAIKTARELATIAENVARKYQTLYVMGCFGAPMTDANKQRYIKHHSYNSKTDRVKRISAASAYTFGFDCICLIKGLLWGWDGDQSATYGGAKYGANNVPDIDPNAMISVCTDVSTDFSDIQVGEVVWLKDHIGVYIGDGLAVECTPIWKDGVQITAVKNIGSKTGYNARTWTKHGKLPYVAYDEETGDTPEQHFGQAAFLCQLQEALGAPVTGKADLVTLGMTVTIGARYNNRHECIKPVQKYLAALGYAEVGEADGCAGSMFTSAVLHFQQDHGCTMTGIMEEWGRTWQELLAAEVKSDG